MTDGDRNGQINGSQEEISSVHQHIIRTNVKKINYDIQYDYKRIKF